MTENYPNAPQTPFDNMRRDTDRRRRRQEPLSFGKTMLASMCGIIIAGAVLSFVGTLIMIGYMASMLSQLSRTETVNVADDTFLTIKLTGDIQDADASKLESFFSDTYTTSMETLLKGIANARDDDRIKGLYIKMGGSSLSWGAAEELRNALIDFQSADKDVVVYGEIYSQPEYYVATASPNVCLHPSGVVDFRGIGAEPLFYKDLFERLGIKVDLIRPASCDYKTAGETYTMNHLSDANREQIRAYISSIWHHVTAGIATSRKMTTEQVNHIADNLSGYMAKGALQEGLVDKLCFEDDVKDLLDDTYGRRHTLSIQSYVESLPPTTSDHHIAIIYAEGNVMTGKSSGIGSGVYGDDIAKAIAEAAKDDKVSAIVLRINSPGGASTASEQMTNAVIRAREQKPVVVSMSNVAASAGYEMACMANTIVAQPTTITGSIGVFGTVPEAGTLLHKKIGISTDTVQTNHNSNALSLMRPLSPTARAIMVQNVEDFYITFTGRVAKGRHLEQSFVDSIARGRVWTGAEALRLGLVDTLGGLDLAVRIAANLADVSDYDAIRYPAAKDWLTQLMELTGNNNRDNGARFSLLHMIKGKQRYAQQPKTLEERITHDLMSLSEEPSVQARIPYYLILN